MKKLFLLFTLCVACAAWAQPFRDKEELRDLRTTLHAEDSLMHLSILKDEAMREYTRLLDPTHPSAASG